MFKYAIVAFAIIASAAAAPGYLAGAHAGAPLLSSYTHGAPALPLGHAAPALAYGHAYSATPALSYAAPLGLGYKSYAAPTLAHGGYAAPALGFGLGYKSYASPALSYAAPAITKISTHGLAAPALAHATYAAPAYAHAGYAAPAYAHAGYASPALGYGHAW